MLPLAWAKHFNHIYLTVIFYYLLDRVDKIRYFYVNTISDEVFKPYSLIS